MKKLLCVAALVMLAGCGRYHTHPEVEVYEHPGATIVVNQQTGYLTYRERFGGYTMTPHGYLPMNAAGPYQIRTSTPGYTYSKSVYWDQHPSAFGIYPITRREVHITTANPPVVYDERINYASLGCAVDESGRPYLREYQTEGTVGKETVSAYGTACRQPDGTWMLVGDYYIK